VKKKLKHLRPNGSKARWQWSKAMTPELRERFWADFKYDHNIKTGQKGKQLCDAHSDKGEKRAKYKHTRNQIRAKRKRKSKNVEINYCASAATDQKIYIYVYKLYKLAKINIIEHFGISSSDLINYLGRPSLAIQLL